MRIIDPQGGRIFLYAGGQLPRLQQVSVLGTQSHWDGNATCKQRRASIHWIPRIWIDDAVAPTCAPDNRQCHMKNRLFAATTRQDVKIRCFYGKASPKVLTLSGNKFVVALD